MRTNPILALACLVLCSFLCHAADISGRWRGEYRNESPTFFQFQQNGEQLTGTVSTTSGDLQIQEGKVTGNDIKFAVTRKIGEREVKISYTGKLNNDVLELEVSLFGDVPRMPMTARRVP